MEEEAVACGLLRLYLERDSVDQTVRERYRAFQQDLKQGTLCRSDYQWAEMALRFLKPYWGGRRTRIRGRWKTHC